MHGTGRVNTLSRTFCPVGVDETKYSIMNLMKILEYSL